MRQPSLPRRRKQGGFIQGVILFALALIAVVIGVFSTSNSTVDTRTDSEEARLNATLMIKVGGDIQDSINRLVADQGDLATVWLGTVGAPEGSFNLWDPPLRYGTAPTLPASILANGVTAVTWSVVRNVAITNAGAADLELIAHATGILPAVCRRLDAAARGVAFAPNAALDTAQPNDRREGCFMPANGNEPGTYFRVVAVDFAPAPAPAPAP